MRSTGGVSMVMLFLLLSSGAPMLRWTPRSSVVPAHLARRF
ncbi:hypothetical protein ACFFX0_21140 [Citricoccus parietis]|uniref:Uncharacterized protein n=1 Tax=Citricoccus parietis TaxID=592307 RepID=A0ABV5G3R2_9MICC